MKNSEKQKHYKEIFNKIGKNSKMFWEVTKSLLKKANNKTEITQLLCNNKIVSNQVDICETFNKHFAEAGKRIQSSISTKDINVRPPQSNVMPCNKKLMFRRISDSYLCRIVSNLKPKKSHRIDDISNYLLKTTDPSHYCLSCLKS